MDQEVDMEHRELTDQEKIELFEDFFGVEILDNLEQQQEERCQRFKEKG